MEGIYFKKFEIATGCCKKFEIGARWLGYPHRISTVRRPKCQF
jgi:hypothetical protein